MNRRSDLARTPVLASLVAALLSAALSGGLLGGVTGLFQRDGMPFGRAAAAERVCADYAFASEREACVRMASSRPPRRAGPGREASSRFAS
ncbi:MAG TPA: hypothetical protein VFF44_02105 [Casimicrobiaceae bacterium]|nr:hypothetical protein [Casimicrobiaceae bacterium]